MAESMHAWSRAWTGGDSVRNSVPASKQLRRSHNRLRTRGLVVTIMHYGYQRRTASDDGLHTRWQERVRRVVTPERASIEFAKRCEKTSSSSRERVVISWRTDRTLRRKTPPRVPSALYTAARRQQLRRDNQLLTVKVRGGSLLLSTREMTCVIFTWRLNAASFREHVRGSHSSVVISSSRTELGDPMSDENLRSRIYTVHQMLLHRSTSLRPN